MCRRQDNQIQCGIENQRNRSNHARQTIEQNHKQHNQQNAQCACLDAGRQCLLTQLRTYGAHADLLQRERQLADVDLLRQGLGGFCCKAAGNYTGITGNTGSSIFRTNRWLGQNLIIHHNFDVIAAALGIGSSFGSFRPLFYRVIVECNRNIVLAGHIRLGNLSIARGCGLDAGAIQYNIAFRIGKRQLCGCAQHGYSLCRVVDCRDVHLHTVISHQFNGRLGIAQRVQTLLQHSLYRCHIGLQICLVVIIVQNCFERDGGAANQIQAATDAIFLIHHACNRQRSNVESKYRRAAQQRNDCDHSDKGQDTFFQNHSPPT